MPKIVPLSISHRRHGRHNNLCTLMSVNMATTARIVSDEDMQIASPQQVSTSDIIIQSFRRSSNDFCVLDDIPLSPQNNNERSRPETLFSIRTTEAGNLGTMNRFARPSPSMCLSSMAGPMDKSTPVTPPCQRFRSCSIDSNNNDATTPNVISSPWGQFVDMIVPEEEEVTHSISNSNLHAAMIGEECHNVSLSRERYGAPYPRNRVRQRRMQPTRIHLSFKNQFSDRSHMEQDGLQDFVLTCPEMDEAALRLGSLSF